jgi:hypothetical protein
MVGRALLNVELGRTQPLIQGGCDVRKMVVPVVLIVLIAATSAEAKTLYVDRANGNDSVSYAANGPSAPWATLGRAAWGSTNRNAPNPNEAARAGDTVLVAAGTYSGPGTMDNDNGPTFNPANSGTNGNPIVFAAQGTVNLTLSSGAGPVIGALARNYITWRGFTINESSAPPVPDMGPVILDNATGIVIEDCDIIGNPNSTWDDNHTGIRLEGAPFATIRNNRISNIYNTGVGSNQENGACIQTYFNTSGLLIEHNEIFNCGSGINLKAIQPDITAPITVRYNLIYGTETGIHYHIIEATPANPTRIYQNIIRDGVSARYGGGTVSGIKFRAFDASFGPIHGKIVNNTIENVEIGFFFNGDQSGGNSNVLWNNIVTNTTYAIAGFANDNSNFNAAQNDLEHNLYYQFATFADTGLGVYTFTTWQSTFGQDASSPASTSTVNPMFVNQAANDFRLQSGSPARTGGIDFLDLNRNGSTTDSVPRGAYVTGNEAIGRTSGGGGTDPTAPAPPSNLRIVG